MRSNLYTVLVALTWAGSCLGGNEWDDNLETTFDELSGNMENQRTDFLELVRQVMLDRYQDEERIRSEGDSGLVGIRNYETGALNYHSFAYTSQTDFAALHDHPLAYNSLGFGEVILTMNGVQFKTKHTDYEALQADPNSDEWLSTVPIEPPPVPQSVLDKPTVAEQVDEMQQYFLAFRDDNITHRDFTDYFKPVLCYVEGTWLSDTSRIASPNEEQIYNAYEWQDLQAEARLESYTGATTFSDQRVANLPRTLVGITESGKPMYAQWFYRVLCHPFTMAEVPRQYFRVVDDLLYRVPNDISLEHLPNTKGARFVYDDMQAPGYHKNVSRLTQLINKVPGMDNVPDGNIKEKDVLGRDTKDPVDMSNVLDRGYYNHIFYDSTRDPYRQWVQYRGFGDSNLYVAMTKQQQVSPIPIDYMTSKGTKKFDDLRYSWMLPLEFVYMTPLQSWNPYNITFYPGDVNQLPAKSVKDGGRDGSDAKPYNGTNRKLFMRTPSEFYTDRYFKYRGIADDMFKFSFVLNDKEEAFNVTASGLATFTSPIGGGVGSVRTRYPIMPLHQEGDPIWKELNGYKTFMNEQFEELSKIFEKAGIRV